MKIDKQKLEDLKIQPVGDGLVDMICSPKYVDGFVALCTASGIRIQGFTWWCHVVEGHEPCGMGGPKSKYYDGWFSEIPMDEIIRLADNESYKAFFENVWPTDPQYHHCYWPAFWLEDSSQ